MIVFSPLTPVENIMRSILEWLHDSAGLPWAWSIVALTIIVRILLVPLMVRQIHSMQSLQRHMPEMKALQQKYKTDKKRQQEELMKFYRENQINPAASCLPLLAQFPVFLSLFFVLRNFSRHPPGGSLSWLGFVPNIADHASAHWSGFLLLAIYAASQVASTYFMSATMPQSQRVMMMILPLVFIFFLLNFPIGLVIYWVTTNLWTVGQGLVTRRLVAKTPPPPKRSSRTPPRPEGPDGGDAARTEADSPQPAPAANDAPQQPRRVKRKKKARR
ncbi:MAG: YidC/Oxa1 family membrane protein insertase [Actinomycetota bacterium]|nr:YidC/Oxa1 family membrane protein insertase [Actinomycetota bacterium]